MPAPSFPLSLPTSPGFRHIDWSPIRRTAVIENPTQGVQQTQTWPYAKWQAVVSLPPLSRAQAGEWSTFFTELEGMRGTFYLGNPSQPGRLPQGGVRNSVNQGVYDIEVQFPAGTTGGVNKGEYVQIGTGASSKLHMITTTGEVDSAQRLTIGVQPSTKASAGSGTALTFIRPVGVFRMLTNDLSWNANQSVHDGFAFACREID